jgi:type II secretory pathway pseudopilin PulG
VLLEVVLALALFVGAATIISSGINASVQAVYRLRLETHAANLAISVLSEMQMGARPITAAGPEPCEAPFTNWNFKVELSQTQSGTAENEGLIPVEVIISHSTERVVYRLTQLFQASEIAARAASATEQYSITPGGFY